MAYQSVHSGPAIDAAVTQLADIQIVRDESNANLATVQNLAAQVATDAGTASTAAASATQTLNDATAAIAAADHARQEQIDAEIAIVADQRFAAEQAATEAVAAADAAVVTVTQDMAASVPTPNKLPLADAQGKIASGWVGADIARAADVVRTDALAAPAGAGLVGFQQAGVGAVARTMQDKARDWVSVRDFGAVGDGVADDTAAIQAAALASDVVFVPPGSYRITAQIVMPQGCTLYSENGSATALKTNSGFNNLGSSIILVEFGAGIVDQGVGITSSVDRANYYNNAAIVMDKGCALKGLSFFYSAQNMFNGSTNTSPPTPYPPAITVAPNTEGAIIQDISLGNAYVGIDLRRKHDDVEICNVVGSPLWRGIRIGSVQGVDNISRARFSMDQAYEAGTFPPTTPSTNTLINWVANNAVGIELHRCTWSSVRDVFVYGYSVGIKMSPEPADPDNALTGVDSTQNIHIDSCGFDSCPVGISGEGNVMFLDIASCHFAARHQYNQAADCYAVKIIGDAVASSNLRIRGCHSHSTAAYAYYVKNVACASVIGNQTQDIGVAKFGAGVWLENCRSSVVSGNTIDGENMANSSIGICVKSSDYCNVSNNTILRVDGHQLLMDGSRRCVVTGNVTDHATRPSVSEVRESSYVFSIIKDNFIPFKEYNAADVDAAGLLAVPVGVGFISYSGTTPIKGIVQTLSPVSGGNFGEMLTIRCGSLGGVFVDEDAATPQTARLFLAAAATFNFGDTITFVSQGQLGWYEVSRSQN